MIGTNDEWSTRMRQICGRIGTAMLTLALCLCGAPIAFAQAEPEQVQKLLADDGAEDDYFGQYIALSGDTAVIAAPGADNGTGSGVVYVFVLDEGTWIQQAKLIPDDAQEGQGFSRSVAVDGDTAVIGAHQDDDNGISSGAAYVFVREGDAWIQQAKLFPNDPNEMDQFGYSSAVHGDTAVVGANYQGSDNRGAAYVFVRQQDGIWTQRTKLVASGGQAHEQFGTKVALFGDTALVTAWHGDTGANDTGAVYVFERTNNAWTQWGKLMADDLQENDCFGIALALEGETALVGARSQNNYTGAAYVFRYDGAAWHLYDKLVAEDAAEHDKFGEAVDVSDDIALIGSEEANFKRGAAYVFYIPTGVQLHKIVAEDGEPYDNFCDVGLVGETALIGANGVGDNGDGAGAAYIFDLNLHLDCPADISNDGVVNASDLLRLLGLWGEEGGEADINFDGIVNTADLLALLGAWGECPGQPPKRQNVKASR